LNSRERKGAREMGKWGSGSGFYQESEAVPEK